MILARVVGNIVATQKNRRYENARVMLCQQITPEGDETSYSVLALDSVDAGVGDTVLIVQEGWSASTAATGEAGAAIDSAIVGGVRRGGRAGRRAGGGEGGGGGVYFRDCRGGGSDRSSIGQKQ